MNNKTTSTTIAFIAMLMFAMVPTTFVYAQSETPDLTATLLYYEPVPATPGSLIDAYIQIENDGNTARRVTVEFVDNGPFSIDSASDRIRSTGSIPSHESFLLKYKVQVGKDALPGTSNIKIQYSIEGGSNVQTMLLPIDIQGSTASLEVQHVVLTPKTFAPGTAGKLTLTLRKLDLAAVDMAPIGGTNQQRFVDLQANENKEFTFELAPSPNIAAGVYKVPVIISFKDQKGTEYDMTEYIGIPVGVEPELLVYFDKTSIASKTKTGEVTIKFVNKGLSQIKFLDMQVVQNNDVQVSSETDRIYVGNINEDDYQTADISLKVAKDTVSVPIRVTYRDALNREYETTINLPLKTVNQPSTSSTNWSTILLVVVVVGTLSYFGYKRFRKQKR
jgi:hypothetical protein